MTGRLLSWVAVAACCGCFGLKPEAETARHVDTFDLSGCSCGKGGKVRSGTSVDGHPLTLGGKVYERGFGTHPESAVAFVSDGRVICFDALVGLDDDSAKAGADPNDGEPSAQFNVWADGRIVWTSGVVKLGQKPVPVHVGLEGAREIILETRGGPPWTGWVAANGDWAEARFTLGAGAELELVDGSAAFAQLGILTPPEKPEPQFNGADIWGVRSGHPVLFRIPVSGVRPMTFAAEGLPDGVTLDAEKGILGGVAPERKGDYDIAVTAANAKGRASRVIRLAVGDRIALTPPMGWNSWNVCSSRLTAERALAAARALEESGLGDYGWAYVNLDDWWTGNNADCELARMRKRAFGGRDDVTGPVRDEKGKVLPNRSFPDMKALTDSIHSYGFKAGIYSSPGPETCGRCEGSYGHEAQDAESWANWGFDYVKYDWCSYSQVFAKETGISEWDMSTWGSPKCREAHAKPYRILGDCLKRQRRDIVYSLCQYGMGRTQEWGEAIGGNCWRSFDDLKDTWNWLEQAVEGRIDGEYWKYSHPGWWADPDMLVVGRLHSFGSDHPTYLTPNEQYTHVSLWAMVGAPLLIGCELAGLDAFTRNLLANDAVIAVSQDRLGRVARRIRHVDSQSVWVRDLADGSKAVALVNRSPVAREISVSFRELGFGSGEHWVRDLWRQRCEGRHAGAYLASVPPHATKLVCVRPDGCGTCR